MAKINLRYIGKHQPEGIYEILAENVPALLESGDWTLDDPDSLEGQFIRSLEDLKAGRYTELGADDAKKGKKKQKKVEVLDKVEVLVEAD